MPDIDLRAPLAGFSNFNDMQPSFQEAIVIDVRKKIIAMIYEQQEKILAQAIPKALEAGLGLAFRSKLISGPAPLMWDAISKVVTHEVQFYLSDTPPAPGSEFHWLPPDAVKQLWGPRPIAEQPKIA